MHIFASSGHYDHQQYDEPSTEETTAQTITVHDHDEDNDIRGAMDALAAAIQPQQPDPQPSQTPPN
eukprot:12084359-Prorocentrum_lima.AAC.1